MVSPSSNSSACQALAVVANNLCKQFSVSCEEEAQEAQWIFLCVGIPLAILAAAFFLGSCGYGIQALKGMKQRCRKGNYHQIHLHEEEGSSGSISSYPVRGVNVVHDSYQSFRLIALSATIAAIGYLILSIPPALQSLCPGNNTCLRLGASAYNGCEWAQEWLIEVAEDLIHSQVDRGPASSIAD